jgi:hypothetical protein
MNGEPVTDIVPYDSQGRLLRDVRLYDEQGRPLEVGPENRWYDGTTDPPPWNVYPQNLPQEGVAPRAEPTASAQPTPADTPSVPVPAVTQTK